MQPFLNYSYAAWDDIMTTENYSKWADEATTLFDSFSKSSKETDQELYQKQLQELYEKTKEILDTTVNNENLRLALRESKKYVALSLSILSTNFVTQVDQSREEGPRYPQAHCRLSEVAQGH